MCPVKKEPPKKKGNVKRKTIIPSNEQPSTSCQAPADEEQLPRKKRKKPEPLKFLTDNTYTELRVTLQATLEILNYLVEKRNYSYLMTSRLNQDNLEVTERVSSLCSNCRNLICL
jgi:hypothetical protein